MDPNALKLASEWGGWPAVFLVVAIAFGKWYCGKKLEQDAKFHDQRLKELHASQEALGCVVDAVVAVVYKSINNEEAARVMADLAAKRLEAARASARVESHQ
jgi:hypothetical protein